ncbi:MFS transporter [Niveomyces insectorum RCEF 264]|uniref:MFS transporter n=1 Tax=Niveomyces insectorum RCEF 264 TaxID=1081102 RepID=A0A167QFC7_9HYPO|nr:MFS transporter [Niveomyces insectorum RCEF 264]
MAAPKETMEVEQQEAEVRSAADVDMKPVPENRLAMAHAMSEEEFLDAEKRLKRKLDFRLLVPLWLMYIMNFLDRNNIAAAKVAGLSTSLHLTSAQYSTAVAILFVSYVLAQIPSNVFLVHLRPSLYLPACMAIWGMMSALTGVVHNFTGLIGSAFSGLIGAGIKSGLEGARGLESWRWLFIIEGSITVFIALVSIIILPDWPTTTWWLTPTERAVGEWRIIKDAGQVDEDGEKWTYGFKLAMTDWRVYVFAVMFFCLQVASATQNFFPSVVQTLGYDAVDTLLLTVPPYALALIISVSNNWSADRHGHSSLHVMWPMALAILGFAIAAGTTKTGPRYFAMMIMIGGGHGANSVLLAWTQKTIIRPRIKRASAIAFVNAAGTLSQTWTSYLYPDSAKPRYVLAMSMNCGFALGCMGLAFFMRLVLQRANKRLDAGENINSVMVGQAQAEVEGISAEEREARKAAFRYIT